MWTPCGHTHLERASGNGCLQCNPERAHDVAEKYESLVAFLINSLREADKGYYSNEEKWISGYRNAVIDVLNHIEENGK